MTRAVKKIHATQIRLPEGLAQAVKKAAATSHRSFNAQLLCLIETALGVGPDGEPRGSGLVIAHMGGQEHSTERHR